MTPERVGRADDERLYQPRIHSRHIRALHQISQELGEPMTVLVDQALTQYIERHRAQIHQELEAAFPEEGYWPDEPNLSEGGATDASARQS